MELDDQLRETYIAPINSETGDIDNEKLWELISLATDARYESDDQQRQIAIDALELAKKDVVFEERPYFEQSTFMLGAAYKDVVIPPMIACHPNTWANMKDEDKAKFDCRKREEYRFT